jgi:hypothetical protein
MTVEQAAQQLEQRLRGYPWYISVGVGATTDGDAIFVYVKSLRHRELSSLKDKWMGFPVFVRATGTIRALGSKRSQAFAL